MDRSKNVHDSYEVVYSEDCRYCYDAGYMKDCYDTYESAFNCELQYECHGCNNGKYLNFAHVSYDNHDANYIDTCHNSGNLFGCIGMRHGKYCVLNKQYSKEEYEELVPRIIEHMQNPIQENTHASACVEYGEFFPTERSLFGYNETLANNFYPLTKDEALARGYKWKDDFEKEEYQGEVYKLPDNIKDTPDDVCKKVLKCKVTGQAYKIIPQELELYRRLGVALPRRCPNQRFRDRMKLQNARALWPHTCAVSGKQIMAPYPPDRGDTVYSHEEFLKMLYG